MGIQLDQSRNEIKHLMSLLENATSELVKVKNECEEHRLAIDIIQAEKETLEAEKETLRVANESLLAERKSRKARHRAVSETFAALKKADDAKLNEISLKLKQKTHQFDSLLESTNAKKVNVAILSIGTQTIKDELREKEMLIVSSPEAAKHSQMAAKAGTKRQNASTDAKRKKVGKSDSCSRKTRNSSKNRNAFTCFRCIFTWGLDIDTEFRGDPDKSGVPEPPPTFSCLEDLKKHMYDEHCYGDEALADTYAYRQVVPVFACEVCNCTFQCKHSLDRHLNIEHINGPMTNKKFYALHKKHMIIFDECMCDF